MNTSKQPIILISNYAKKNPASSADSSRKTVVPLAANLSSDSIKYAQMAKRSILMNWLVTKYASPKEENSTPIKYSQCRSVAKKEPMQAINVPK